MRKELQDRLKSPLMQHYKAVYKNSKLWQGEPLEGKRVIVYCEQGLGDIIQFSRYFKPLKERGCYLIAHCPKSLHKLLAGHADEFLDKDLIEELPPHDYHVMSLELPFALDVPAKPVEAYIHVNEVADLGEHADFMKIGIAWEGSVNHSNNADRCCPLEFFAQLAEMPNTRVFMIQDCIHNPLLLKNAENMDLYSVPLTDFYETAKLINAMDVIVTVDTSVMHLAGAMGKKTFGLLSLRCDMRWDINLWYRSLVLIRQNEMGDWDNVFKTLFEILNLPVQRRRIEPPKDDGIILLTGGIGDVITLESFMTDEQRSSLRKIYYATRATEKIVELFVAARERFPNLVEHESIWDQFDDHLFSFQSKAEIGSLMSKLPHDWPQTNDWSIANKFAQIYTGRYTYNDSSFLKVKLADVSRFWPGRPYVVVAPCSDNSKKLVGMGRNFDENDWLETLSFLAKNDLYGVVLNVDEQTVPKHRLLIDLSKQTTLCESIEMLKGACGYIGVNSCLSVLAAKLFDKILCVKNHTKHLQKWAGIYYAPKTTFEFINQSVSLGSPS